MLTLSKTAFYLDSSKLKVFADDNFRFDKNAGTELVDNTAGKGEIAHDE